MKILKNIFLISIITLIFIEISFRFIPKSIIPNLGPNRINVDFHEFGPWFVPKQKTSFSSPCFFTYPITINKYGMRDKERKIEKNNKFRIAILGDSIMEALQVPDYKYSSIIIEENLIKRNYDVEVLNFSFSGYGTAQQLALYNALVKNFKPDLVVLFTLASNDLRNNSRDLEYLAYGKDLKTYGTQLAPAFSYYEYENEKLIYYPNLVKNSNIKRYAKSIIYNVYSADYLRKLFLNLKRIKNLKNIENNNKNNLKNEIIITNKTRDNSKELINEYFKKAKINTYQIIKKFKNDVEINDGKLMQVIYNDSVENSKIFENIAKENFIEYLSFGPKDNDIYKSYLLKNNIEFKETHPVCDGHPNAIGHKIIAEITTNWLEKMINKYN